MGESLTKRERVLVFVAMPLVMLGIACAPARASDSAAPVRPLSAKVLGAKPQSERARKLMQTYYDSVLDWGEILLERMEPVPGHPDWGYYGRGGHREDDVRPIAYAAMVNAFLAEVRPPSGGPDTKQRARMRRDAIAALRYLTQSHVTGRGTCLDGESWGNQWQSAIYARSAGMAGWMLWPSLDGQMKAAVARLVEHEADRFLHKPPKSSEFKDTGAEENSWNAMALALACNMMPDHPRAAQWAEAAKRYLYNSLSVAADSKNDSLGDDGRPVQHWVTTVNAHPDFTVENHGLVHVGYLKLTVAQLMESTAHYLAAGAAVPQACFHHTSEAFEVMQACMSWDGVPIYFGGNDWKVVHTQCTDVIIYAMMSLLSGDGRAAYLEEVALDRLRRIQQKHEGYYNVRRDLEYGGLCATRLVACYLAHAVLGEGAKPVSEAEFSRRISGVRHLKYAQAILHRTPTKFASFSWGPKRMALALPRDGTWVIWPHYASYLGLVNGNEGSRRSAELIGLRHDIQPDSFSVTGTLNRFDGGVMQDFSYASLPKDITVYVERLRVADGFRLTARETGVVGHEYELGTNRRELYGRFGKQQVVAVGGQARVLQLKTDWLNIGDRVGYVVRRAEGRENLMRYHDQVRGSGRVPKLQEWLSLIGEQDPTAYASTGDWACVVTFLNQPAKETARWAGRMQFNVDGNVATCRIGEDVIRVDFTEMETHTIEPRRYGLYWWHPTPANVWYMAGWGGQFCMVWPEYNVVMVKVNATTREHTNLQGKKKFGVRRIYPVVHRSFTGTEFAVPFAWKVGARAKGAGDTDWKIPLDYVPEKE